MCSVMKDLRKVENSMRMIKFPVDRKKIVEWQWKMVARMEIVLWQTS